MSSGTSNLITSVAMLATLPTLNRRVGELLQFWNTASESLVTYRLTATTTPTGAGVQRPTDYNAITNAKAWVGAA